MNVQIQSLHFNVGEQLAAFIEKKTQKLQKLVAEDAQLEIVLKVTKPETNNNKEVTMTLPGALRAEKVADTFENAIDECIDILKRQIERKKDN